MAQLIPCSKGQWSLTVCSAYQIQSSAIAAAIEKPKQNSQQQPCLHSMQVARTSFVVPLQQQSYAMVFTHDRMGFESGQRGCLAE